MYRRKGTVATMEIYAEPPYMFLQANIILDGWSDGMVDGELYLDLGSINSHLILPCWEIGRFLVYVQNAK